MASKPRFEIALLATILLGGAALRFSQVGQSLFGDELWSWVGATDPSFGGMLDWVEGDQEITPPLYTALAWISVRLGDDRTLIDLPSLLAGIATIALVFGIARILAGRRVALIAAAFAALSPTLSFFAVEARAYSLAIALVAASTLVMLLVTEEGRSGRWWIAYAALSAAAMYTHYTAAFVLLAQIGWLLWFRPEARRPALLANVGAAVAFIPWVPGLLADFDSPARINHELLAPFGVHNFFSFLGTFSFGHPYASLGRPSIGLNEFLGTWAELALFGGLAIAAIGLLAARLRRGEGEPEVAGEPAEAPHRREGLILIGMLALAAPVGCVVVSLLGDDLYLPRNLITSLPALLIACAALIGTAPFAPRVVAIVLTGGALAYGALSMLQTEWQRPDVKAAAELIDREAEPGDVVLDAVWFAGQMPEGYSPPAFALTLDAHLDAFDDVPPTTDSTTPSSIAAAEEAAAGHRLWIVGPPALVETVEASLATQTVDPAVQEVYGGLAETEAVAIPIPPAGEGAS